MHEKVFFPKAAKYIATKATQGFLRIAYLVKVDTMPCYILHKTEKKSFFLKINFMEPNLGIKVVFLFK
jgi:hypothetical protein